MEFLKDYVSDDVIEDIISNNKDIVINDLVYNQDNVVMILNYLQELGIENINRSKFIALIVNEILKIIDEDFDNVLNEYKDASCVLNKKVEFRYKGQIYNGIAKDINNLGNLIVKCDNQEYTLNSGEVSIIQKNYE